MGIRIGITGGIAAPRSMFTTIIMAINTTAIGITTVTAQATTGIRRHDIRSAHTINAPLELAIIRAPT